MSNLSVKEQKELDERIADKAESMREKKLIRDVRDKHLVNFIKNLSDKDSETIVKHLTGIINSK